MAGDMNWLNTMGTCVPYKQHTISALGLPSQVSTSTNAHATSPRQDTIEWAKFAMWLRGYLSAIEGKELTTEDREKIMEKLATVDPESQDWRFDEPNPYVQPYNPRGSIPSIPPPTIGSPTIGNPIWTYTTSNTAEGEEGVLNDMLRKRKSWKLDGK